MKSILIKNVFFENRKRNILIEKGRFKSLDAADGAVARLVIDATGKAILPALYNTHTHTPMTLLRGYADDMPLERWLTNYVWPYENNMTDDDFGRGSNLAAKEMVSSGTVFFNEMYFGIHKSVDAAVVSGMRAAIGLSVLGGHKHTLSADMIDAMEDLKDPTGGRICFTVAPHSVYTVPPEEIKKCAQVARRKGLRIHIHCAETKTEVANCVRDYGMRPVELLDSLGVLGPDVILAHCVQVTEKEVDILAERQAVISHCPCSNMKLGSGRFPYELMIKAGCRITLGTDGASSGNNLDLREAMKFAALLAKSAGDPVLLPAEQIFDWATRAGAEAFGIDAGEIRVGKLADCLLVDLGNVRMQPCYNLISNFVYSADSSCIDTVICDGNIIYNRI